MLQGADEAERGFQVGEIEAGSRANGYTGTGTAALLKSPERCRIAGKPHHSRQTKVVSGQGEDSFTLSTVIYAEWEG